MKETLKSAKQNIRHIKFFAIFGIVIGITLVFIAIWFWGLVTSARDLSAIPIFTPYAIPVITGLTGILFLLIAGSTRYIIYQINKVLNNVKNDEREE